MNDNGPSVQVCRKDISIKVSTREGSNPVISAKRDQGVRCMKKPKQVVPEQPIT